MNPQLQILFGLSVGDALEAATADLRPDAIPAAFAPLSPDAPDAPPSVDPCEATSHTQMVIATLDGYTKRNVLRGLVEWTWSNPADMDLQTRRALQRQLPWSGMISWMESGGAAATDGGLTRAPAVLIAGGSNESLLHEAVYTTALTHPDPRCLYASAYLVALLEELQLRGDAGAHQRAWARASNLNLSAITETRRLHPEDHAEALRAKHLIRRRSADARDQVQARIEAAQRGESAAPSGAVLDTLQAALVSAQAPTFLEGVQAAVLSGPDSGAVACVTGAVLAARGLPIPPALIRSLRVGHSWTAWSRAWSCEQHYPSLVPPVREFQS